MSAASEPVPRSGEAAGDFDAVVIGAGLGGLTCAAYLSAAGLRVLVLDQHDVAGGSAHVFRRRRSYEFDVGVHYLGDCGEDGLIPAILGGLGLQDRVRYLPMDQDGFDHIVMPGLTVKVPAGWGNYRRRVVQALPDEAPGLTRYFDICEALSELIANTSGTARGADRAVSSGWRRRTLADLFDACELSTRARSVLAAQSGNYGLAPWQASVGMHVRMIDHYLRGAYYPEGGGQVLVASLVEALEASGGTLWTRAAVSRVCIENGQATGVVLTDGRTISAGLVVSNADYRRTVLELVGADAFTPAVVGKAEKSVAAAALTTLYIGVDTDLSDRPNANVWWLRDGDIEGYYRRLEAGFGDTVDYLFCSFTSRKDPDNRSASPPGHGTLQLITLTPPGRGPWGLPEDRPASRAYRRNELYRKEKQRVAAAMLDAGEEALGPFRDRILYMEAATPLTHERYVWSAGGSPYGLAHWGGNIEARPDVRTTVPGLYLVGQSGRTGGGVGGVMLGGLLCAGQILGLPLLSAIRDGSLTIDPPDLPPRPADWDPLVVSRGAARRTARGLARMNTSVSDQRESGN